MESQFEFLVKALIIGSGLLAVSNIVYIIIDLFSKKHESILLETLLRIMAAFAGVLLLSLSVFYGKPLPSLISSLLFQANPFSFSIILFGYILPAFSGVGVSIFIVRAVQESSSRSIRVLTFVNSCVVTFFIYSVISVCEYGSNMPKETPKEEIFSKSLAGISPSLTFLTAIFIYLVLMIKNKRVTNPSNRRPSPAK